MGKPSPKQATAIVAVVAVLCVLIAVSVLKQQQQKRPPPPPTPTTPSIWLPNPSGWSPTPASSAASSYYSGWLPAKATWYGAPTGAGPIDNGGACGFKHTNHYPFSSMTSCGNEPIFKDGKGCGACYQIRCLKSNHPACSGHPQMVMITDMNYYPVATYHFDLSGTAFGSMADWGLNDKLRHAGIIDIQFRRVQCNFPGLFLNFHVERGSNPNYLAVLIEYANKDGTVAQVDLMEANSGYWVPMRESWGDIWRMDSYRPLKGPFSFRVRSDSGETVVANNVIPANWQPNTDYRSYVQFN